MSKVNRIIIHCSDSPDTTDIGVKEIREWHRARGWTDIGYHYVVRRNGTIELGRKHNGDSVLEGSEIGAHTKGHNSDSLAICWVGRTKPSYEQYHYLCLLILRLLDAHNLEPSDVYGHCEFDKGKTCPNLDMDKLRGDLDV